MTNREPTVRGHFGLSQTIVANRCFWGRDRKTNLHSNDCNPLSEVVTITQRPAVWIPRLRVTNGGVARVPREATPAKGTQDRRLLTGRQVGRESRFHTRRGTCGLPAISIGLALRIRVFSES
jgi:hypothetical protein